jgi:hypothetical protein
LHPIVPHDPSLHFTMSVNSHVSGPSEHTCMSLNPDDESKVSKLDYKVNKYLEQRDRKDPTVQSDAITKLSDTNKKRQEIRQSIKARQEASCQACSVSTDESLC